LKEFNEKLGKGEATTQTCSSSSANLARSRMLLRKKLKDAKALEKLAKELRKKEIEENGLI
jgi:hypothetical protein